MRGAGRFVDDTPLPGELHCLFPALAACACKNCVDRYRGRECRAWRHGRTDGAGHESSQGHQRRPPCSDHKFGNAAEAPARRRPRAACRPAGRRRHRENRTAGARRGRADRRRLRRVAVGGGPARGGKTGCAPALAGSARQCGARLAGAGPRSGSQCRRGRAHLCRRCACCARHRRQPARDCRRHRNARCHRQLRRGCRSLHACASAHRAPARCAIPWLRSWECRRNSFASSPRTWAAPSA